MGENCYSADYDPLTLISACTRCVEPSPPGLVLIRADVFGILLKNWDNFVSSLSQFLIPVSALAVQSL